MKHLLILLLMGFYVNSHAKKWHIRPISIHDYLSADIIFIGKIICYEKLDHLDDLITFRIEQKFKYRKKNCFITLKIRTDHPNTYKPDLNERWLIFANNMWGSFFLDEGQSTGLDSYQTYPFHLIQKDLNYLFSLVDNPTQYIYATAQMSAIGCIPNDDYYTWEGQLNEGFPDGYWMCSRKGGYIEEEGYYEKGKKTGIWLRFWENGHLYEEILYVQDSITSYKRYAGNGLRVCTDDECWSR